MIRETLYTRPQIVNIDWYVQRKWAVRFEVSREPPENCFYFIYDEKDSWIRFRASERSYFFTAYRVNEIYKAEKLVTIKFVGEIRVGDSVYTLRGGEDIERYLGTDEFEIPFTYEKSAPDMNRFYFLEPRAGAGIKFRPGQSYHVFYTGYCLKEIDEKRRKLKIAYIDSGVQREKERFTKA